MKALPTILALLGLTLAEPSRALSLAEAEHLAETGNRELALAATAAAAAQAGIITAGQRPNPALSLQSVNIDPHRGIGLGPLKDKSVDSTVGLTYLIERGEKREHRLGAAEALGQAARLDLANTRREQRLALHQSYFDLKLAQERLQILGESLDLARKSLEAAAKRVATGDLAPLERTRLEVDVARVENDRRSAEADLAAARGALAILLGDPTLAATLTADDLWPQPASPPDAPATIETRPDVGSAAAREEAARRGRELARSQAVRDLTVGTQYERFPPDNRGSFGVQVSIPLFWSHRYEGDIAKAEADLTAARISREKTIDFASIQTIQVRAQLEAARDRLVGLADTALPAAEESARGVEFAYARGAASLTDLLDARRQLRAIQLEIVQVRAEYAKALAAWRAATEWEKRQ